MYDVVHVFQPAFGMHGHLWLYLKPLPTVDRSLPIAEMLE